MLKRLLLIIFPILIAAYANTEEIPFDEENSNEVAKDVHGLLDIVFKNDYITPRGLLVTNTGLTIQVLSILNLDIYKDPNQFINSVSLNLGVWNDIWTNQHDPTAGSWNELDWFIGLTFSIRNNWKFQAEFLEFLSPPGNFTPENNAEFTLTYDDSCWKWPLTFYPYVKLFWAISGDSTVIVGKPGGTYYVELGMLPTIKFENSCFPVTFTAPTWLSMGPADFWNGGELALKDSHSNFGVFSTGLKGTIPLQFIPKRLGNWYADIGFQEYYLINNNLLQAQLLLFMAKAIEMSL